MSINYLYYVLNWLIALYFSYKSKISCDLFEITTFHESGIQNSIQTFTGTHIRLGFCKSKFAYTSQRIKFWRRCRGRLKRVFKSLFLKIVFLKNLPREVIVFVEKFSKKSKKSKNHNTLTKVLQKNTKIK